MGLYIVFLSLTLIICMAIAYGIYKLIWYAVKMLLLRRTMRLFGKERVIVEPQRRFSDILFGNKGEADYRLRIGNNTYEVSVISFISTHGRWNIEKAKDGYYIESRHMNKAFYRTYVDTSAPDHATEYKKEVRMQRKPLFLTPTEPTFAKQILLLYPCPKRISYTDAHYHELIVGDIVEGHVIMNMTLLKELIPNTGRGLR